MRGKGENKRPWGVDMVGFKSRTFTVIAFAGRSAGSRRWECLCECGERRVFDGQHIKKGLIRCRCYRKDKHPLFNVYSGMIVRCYYEPSTNYPNYGGRSISVCDRWLKDFYAFVVDMGPRPEGTTLDRIDNNGNYEPNNCRWATKIEQHSNTRKNVYVEHGGKKQTLAEWARELGIGPCTFADRLYRKLPTEKLFHVGRLPGSPHTRLSQRGG